MRHIAGFYMDEDPGTKSYDRLNPPRLEETNLARPTAASTDIVATSRQVTCAQKEGSETSSLVLYHAAFSSMA